MDIMNLLKNFLSNGNAQALLPVLNLLRENSFDIKRTLNSLTPETLAPIIQSFAPISNPREKPDNAYFNGVAPIANVADKEIVYALNRYVNAEI